MDDPQLLLPQDVRCHPKSWRYQRFDIHSLTIDTVDVELL